MLKTALPMALAYLLALVLLLTLRNFDPLDLRLVSPAWPLLWLSLLSCVVVCKGSWPLALSARSAALLLLVAASLVGYQGLLRATSNLKKFDSPGWHATQAGIYHSYTVPAAKNPYQLAMTTLAAPIPCFW